MTMFSLPFRFTLASIRAMQMIVALTFVLCTVGYPPQATGQGGDMEELAEKFKKAISGEKTGKTEFKDFKEVTKDAKKHEGLFTLYEKDQQLYAEIKPKQFGEQLLAPMAIARGMAAAGTPLNFGDEWVLTFKRVGDQVQLIRKNIHYEAPKDSPLAKAVEQNYTDSVLMALPIVSINPTDKGVLIDLGDIFLTNFADLPFGSVDPGRTSWHKVKVFPNNVELQVESTFRSQGAGTLFFGFGDPAVADPRGITLVIHYSLTKRPESGYTPRFADHRVGHFLSATKDFGSDDPTTNFRRRVNRWRLEKANPDAKLSPPKKQLVWWVENTVPHEYRPAVEEGILEWNKAFERIGFRNAIGVRWQNERDEFDPEDINYCTFRWITTPYTFAMSGLRADPVSGEMIDGDVIFDASWIREWKDEYALLVGEPVAGSQPGMLTVLDVGEIISPIMAIRHGYGLPYRLPQQRTALSTNPVAKTAELHPADRSSLHWMLSRRLTSGHWSVCQYAVAKRHEYALAAIAMASQKGEGEQKDDKEGLKLPEEFISQAIKEVVMHEVGHSLGLRHNFRASAMLPLDQINDPTLTRTKGMVGSVMDYNPLNIVRKGNEQGDYATTTIGPYDYWAIEYAYKPLPKDKEGEELKKIAARSPQPELAYATDEDLYMSNDPLVNAYDLGSDPLEYGKQRIATAKELLRELDDNVVPDGESWGRLRTAFSVLLGQFGNAAYLASSYIAGQHVARDAKGTENSREPVTPVAGAEQREALDFLVREILSDQAFQFPAQLLRRLTTEHWYHWGSDSMGAFMGSGFDVYDRILGIQRIVLNHCFDPSVLRRLQNQQLLSDDQQPLQMAEVFRALTDGIWSELQADKGAGCSTIRRNLQREHLRNLYRVAIGPRSSGYDDLFAFVVFLGGSSTYPADARSLARMHLKEIAQRIDKTLASGATLDDVTRAHLEECRDQIAKIMNARLEANQP
jgi:hypothetical protein